MFTAAGGLYFDADFPARAAGLHQGLRRRAEAVLIAVFEQDVTLFPVGLFQTGAAVAAGAEDVVMPGLDGIAARQLQMTDEAVDFDRLLGAGADGVEGGYAEGKGDGDDRQRHQQIEQSEAALISGTAMACIPLHLQSLHGTVGIVGARPAPRCRLFRLSGFQHPLNAVEGLLQVLHAGGDGDAHMAGEAERGAGHQRHARLGDQIL